MSKKLLNRYAKQYSAFQMEDADMSTADAKRLRILIEADFKAGFTTAAHLLKKENEKMTMLRVILDQHFDAEEVNLEEVGKAVGICFGYI